MLLDQELLPWALAHFINNIFWTVSIYFKWYNHNRGSMIYILRMCHLCCWHRRAARHFKVKIIWSIDCSVLHLITALFNSLLCEFLTHQGEQNMIDGYLDNKSKPLFIWSMQCSQYVLTATPTRLLHQLYPHWLVFLR